MPIEDQLWLLYSTGVSQSLENLGWRKIRKETTCAFVKAQGNLSEFIAFDHVNQLAHSDVIVVPRTLVEQVLANTDGITFEEFLAEYIRIYKGRPPNPPL